MSDRRRVVSLLGSVLIALSAGSTYVFSTYAPQLQDALHLSSTQLNVLGLAGNLGMYMSGPIWGRWIDRSGPYGAITSGAFLVLIGYGMLSRAYKYGWTNVPVVVLALFCLLTGLGNSAGNNAAINVQARSWNEQQRASAMALVLSEFGLSAFVYSTLSHAFFTDNVTGYLDLLALGSFTCFVTGMALIKTVPPQPVYLPEHPIAEEETRPVTSQRKMRRSTSETSARVIAWIQDVHESEYHVPEAQQEDAAGNDEVDEAPLNITGLALLRNTDFLLLFIVIGLLSGSGLLLINNVGIMTRALWDYAEKQHKNPLESTQLAAMTGVTVELLKKKGRKMAMQKVQALQVSCLSVGNATGRILIGFTSDVLVHMTRKSSHRTFLLLPIVLLAIVSQGLAAWPNVITTVHRLLFVSGITGLMYGFLFGLGPVLVFEWFGMSSFSQNWGWMSFAPVIVGNVYNIMFGRCVPRVTDMCQCVRCACAEKRHTQPPLQAW